MNELSEEVRSDHRDQSTLLIQLWDGLDHHHNGVPTEGRAISRAVAASTDMVSPSTGIQYTVLHNFNTWEALEDELSENVG